MLYELEKTQFKNISHLLVGKRCNLEIKAVVELNNPGWIFVDNPLNPKTALVWSRGIKGFYFVGDENNPKFNEYINDYIDNIIMPRAKKTNLKCFECSGTSTEWDNRIEKLFGKRKLNKSYQYVYKLKEINQASIAQRLINEKYEVRQVDNKLLNEKFKNKDFLISDILDWWDSIEDFLDKGVGFCIIYGDMIVSICISSFVSKDSWQSHIETLDEHRRNGLAKKTVTEFLKFCKENNYEPYWDCMKTNIASYSTAESLGYKKDFEYALYEFPFES